MKRLAKVALILLGLLVAVLVGRTLSLPLEEVAVPPADPVAVDADAAAARLAQAVRFRTVSQLDPTQLDARAFLDFQDWLTQAYPRTHATLGRERVGGYSLLYTWPGRDPGAEPVLLLAHQDVVPVSDNDLEHWVHPPFAGAVSDGYVWGRGSMDDKGNLIAILEAVEHLIGEGFVPRRSILLAFGHDEEVGGVRGAKQIAKLLAERKLTPDYVLDEGGVVIQGIVPGYDGAVAAVGIAEKGYLSVEIIAPGTGGHSSTPPPHTAVGRLAGAIGRLESRQMPARIDGVTGEFFRTLAPVLPFRLRFALANLWLFRPLVLSQLEASRATNATIRTTTAVTMLEGSPKDNVLPNEARAVVNFRLLPGDSVDDVLAHVKAAVADPEIEVKPLAGGVEASPVSDTSSESYQALRRTILQVYPDAYVAPMLVVGGTDARHYTGLSPDVYRFSAARFGPDDLPRVHGINERVAVAEHAGGVRFFVQLLRNTAR